MISASKGTRIVKKLERRGLVKKHRINVTGERGGITVFLELTSEAYKALKFQPKKGIGIGAGFEHGFWQYHIAEALRSIREIEAVTIEGMLNDKAIDILVVLNKERVAVEVAMSAVNEMNNIKKDIDKGCSIVFIACRDKNVLSDVSKLTKSLDDEMRNKVRLGLAQKLTDDVKEYIYNQNRNCTDSNNDMPESRKGI